MKRQEVEYEVATPDEVEPAISWARSMINRGLAGGEVVVIRLGRIRRTLEQNKFLWAMCADLSKQVKWHGQTLDKDDWKDLFTGSMRGQTPVPGIGGGVVFLGGGSSRLSVKQFSELIDMMQAFGAEEEVRWSKESKEAIEYARRSRGRKNQEPDQGG